MKSRSKFVLLAFSQKRPDVSALCNNIGNVNRKQGTHEDALSMYKKSLRIQLSVLGCNHPDIARSYCNIALTDANQGRHKATALMRDK
ncbi:Kinesin light chain 4 [Trichoplax sp. H2]|nr:Kinesin light chain 4 [Trichoplax sp. H2]|eukprot:RDD47923.1 Kinesin light chain 4 [Trichoplax sp. H2]